MNRPISEIEANRVLEEMDEVGREFFEESLSLILESIKEQCLSKTGVPELQHLNKTASDVVSRFIAGSSLAACGDSGRAVDELIDAARIIIEQVSVSIPEKGRANA